MVSMIYGTLMDMTVCSQENMVYMIHRYQNCPGLQRLKELTIHELYDDSGDGEN